MTPRAVLPQIGGLLLFVVLVATLFGGHRLYLRARTARLQRAASRPVPGRLPPVDAAYLEQTAAWLRSLRPPPARLVEPAAADGRLRLRGRGAER